MPAAIPIAMVASAAISGAMAKSAAGKAADAQTAAADKANATSQAQYDQTRADQLALLAQQRTDQAPWREAGAGALGQLTNGTAPGGQFTQTYQRTPFEADPGYQFRVSEGEKGIQRAASSQGGMYSGATLKALARFNGDSASQEYANYDTRQNNAFNQFQSNQNTQVNRLQSLAGIGQSATNQVQAAGTAANSTIANAAMNNSNNIGNNQIGAGNARASGYVGGANAVTGAIGQGINSYLNNNLIQSLSRGNSSYPAQGGANPYGYDSSGYPVDNSGGLQFDP